jgi:uncharacterized membrane protein YidH (DUF202 family)
MTTPDNSDDRLLHATEPEKLAIELAQKRTDMAAERTDMALIRTGFTGSSFGAGLTQIIGRGVWPSQAVDLVTILFILAGALSVQIGLVRLLKRIRAAKGTPELGRHVGRLLVLGVSLLQVALLAIMVMVIVHM